MIHYTKGDCNGLIKEFIKMDLSKYYESITTVPLLTREQEYDLFLEYSDPAASPAKKKKIQTQIIRSNLRFAFKQAKYYSNGDPFLFEELIGAANEGLLVGFEKYKPTPEVRFLSYAGWWVNQRILHAMSKVRIVALPIWRQQLGSRIQKYLEANPDCKFDQLKTEFPEVSEKDLRELSESKFLTFYIEDMGTDSPEFEIDPIGTEVEQRIDKERIHRMIDELPSPHKEIIFMTYGIKDGEERTHAEMASDLGISKDQLRAYKREAMEMLKDKLTPP
jgi:RNA polymerase sigma factor (sigma-70 family)